MLFPVSVIKKGLVSLGWAFCACVLFCAQGVSAAESEDRPFAKVILADLTQSINLIKSGFIVHDPEQRWTMASFRNAPQSWRTLLGESNSKIESLGGQYWLILEIDNATQRDNWYLNFTHSRTDDIEVLVRDLSGQTADQYWRGGMEHPPEERIYVGPGHVFPIKLFPNKSQLLLIKVRSVLFEGSLYVHLDTEQYHQETFGTYQTVAVLFIGMMLSLAIYNFFIFVGTRDQIYLWYMLAGLCITVTWGSYFGVMWQLTGYTDPARHVAALTQLGSTLFALLFTRDFLNVRVDCPRLNFIYSLAAIFLVVTMCAFPFVHAAALYLVYWLSVLPLSLLMLCSGLWRMSSGYRAARFIIVGHALVTIGLFVTGLSYLRLMPFDAPQPLVFAYSSTVEMLMFGLAMADRIRQLHHAKLNAEQATEIKSTFLAIMSHEIRTPLAGLLSVVRLLGNSRLTVAQRKLVNTIGYSGEALLSLLNDTLDYSRMEANKLDIVPRDFDLRLLADSLVMLMEGRASEKGLILTSQVDPSLPAVLHGDVNRMRQILINLLANAIKFTDHGIVKLQIERTVGDTVGFMVIDSGMGMSEEVQKQIFMPFGQGRDVQRRFGGAGLGLNISRNLARAMGGDITVESLEGRGSTFRFSVALPAGNVTSAQLLLGEPLPALAEITGTLQLLVVDDAEINRIAAKGLLEHEGHRVTVASSAEEALRYVQDQAFDCILMDVHMPGMDGATAIRQIRALSNPDKRNVGIIALTAWLQEGEEQELLAYGADAVCTKPIDVRTIYMAFAKLKPRNVAREANEDAQRSVVA